MIDYSTLAPLLGQALALSRRDGRPRAIAWRYGFTKARPGVIEESVTPRARAEVIVSDIRGTGLSGEALDGATSLSPDDRAVALRVLRAVTGHPDGTPFSAEDIAAGLWLLACNLSTLDREERERAPRVAGCGF